ncbi:hypothetical protein NIES4071_52200 [Calothrix sp. NIES-4071]|nr:hypothetical protein NIES4071_52200 [Calothrix sp. NIES-4071]BAZ59528.1 hypothetical protein NIES4105_52150 [Calothrix sp. NIES-4105]
MQQTIQSSLKELITAQYVNNPQEWLEVNISTSGLLNLTIVSNRFVGLSIPQRKEQVLNFIKQSQISHLSPGFLGLYTLQEAESLDISRPLTNGANVYTWQDLALLAANPQNQPQALVREPREPRTVTFYSFKGGVGRTTALTHVAWILAMRGRKVVAVDLDLEAPGLSAAFNLNPKPSYGIVDYFYERSYLPEGLAPSISVSQILGEVKITNATGRLFVVPAGDLNLDYLSKVDDLRAATITETGENLWYVFHREIQEQLKPDIILVDSQSGINQWGTLSLFQAADDVIIFLFPNEQNQQGIDLVLQPLQALKNIPINFVFTPVSDVTETGISKVRKILKSLHDKITITTNQNNEEFDEAIEALVVPYLQPIALADIYPVPAVVDYYTKIANLIDEETERRKINHKDTKYTKKEAREDKSPKIVT